MNGKAPNEQNMNTTKPAHTPTPWASCKDHVAICGGVDSLLIASCGNLDLRRNPAMSKQEIQANAEFIVRACNSHQALVDALEECLSQISHLRGEMSKKERFGTTPTSEMCIRQARAALALAEGKQ